MSLRPTSFTLDSAPEESLALVWVALANNIGTDIPRANDIPVDLPPDVESVENAIIRDGIVGAYFFDEHFPRIAEFTEVLNINVVNYLRLHPDKLTALEFYIDELEQKMEDGQEALTSLTQLASTNANALPQVQAQITTAQNDIEVAYANRDGDVIMNRLQDLEELRIEEQDHKHATLFANRMAQEYSVLIAASVQKLTVLRANTAALVKGVTVTLPAWVDIRALQDLKIFITDQ